MSSPLNFEAVRDRLIKDGKLVWTTSKTLDYYKFQNGDLIYEIISKRGGRGDVKVMEFYNKIYHQS